MQPSKQAVRGGLGGLALAMLGGLVLAVPVAAAGPRGDHHPHGQSVRSNPASAAPPSVAAAPATAAPSAASGSVPTIAVLANANAGDIWVDTIGAPAGPGHETDPHLSCGDIALWGVRLGDPSGRYQVTAISPARLGTVVNASTWQYAGSGSTSEVIAVVRLASLTAALSRTGAPATGHFEIALIGDPRKQKTFWISCAPVIGTSPPPRTPPVSPPAAPPTPAVPSSGVTVGSGSTSSVAPRAGATVVGGVLGLTTTPDTGTLLPLGLGALLALLGGATLTARRFFPGGRR